MKANGSRREEREEKISRKKSVNFLVHRNAHEMKSTYLTTLVGVAVRWGGGGGRCGAGRARAGPACGAQCGQSSAFGAASKLFSG
ncbi:unnamed protein product [Leptosia nina]|uniref:Uncharacterized protein n=1 Tax=Leptosia nina TaxID=320188 RepID=A0AAV1JS72_9NEOP